MPDYRLLEDGSRRLLQDGSFRLVEVWPPASGFTDSLATLNSSVYDIYGTPAPAAANGGVEEVPNTTYPTILTKARYSLIDSSVYVLLDQVPTNQAAAPQPTAGFMLEDSRGQRLEVVRVADPAEPYYMLREKRVDSYGNVSFSDEFIPEPPGQPWLRIRESGGTVHMESAPTGGSGGPDWVLASGLRSFARSITVGSMAIGLYAGTSNGAALSGASANVRWKNLNHTPAGTPPSAWAAFGVPL